MSLTSELWLVRGTGSTNPLMFIHFHACHLTSIVCQWRTARWVVVWPAPE